MVGPFYISYTEIMLIEHGPNKEEPWFSEASHQNFDISEIFTVKCFLKFNFILPFFFFILRTEIFYTFRKC